MDKKNPNYNKDYYQKNKEKVKEQSKINYEKNKETRLKGIKEYNKKNKDKLRLISKRWQKNTRENDKNFNITTRLRSRVRSMFSDYTKTGKVRKSKDYGINYQAILKHLNPFPKNIRKYHIDHIKPLVSFNFINDDDDTNENEIRKAFAPENHQWLLAKDNQSKGGRI